MKNDTQDVIETADSVQSILLQHGLQVPRPAALDVARQLITGMRASLRDWRGQAICCAYHESGGNQDAICIKSAP